MQELNKTSRDHLGYYSSFWGGKNFYIKLNYKNIATVRPLYHLVAVGT